MNLHESALPTWTVSYDIGANRNRRLVADELSRWGVRVLYSVFNLGVLTDHDLDTTMAAVTDHLAPSDSLILFRRCDDCQVRVAGPQLDTHRSWHLP